MWAERAPPRRAQSRRVDLGQCEPLATSSSCGGNHWGGNPPCRPGMCCSSWESSPPLVAFPACWSMAAGWRERPRDRSPALPGATRSPFHRPPPPWSLHKPRKPPEAHCPAGVLLPRLRGVPSGARTVRPAAQASARWLRVRCAVAGRPRRQGRARCGVRPTPPPSAARTPAPWRRPAPSCGNSFFPKNGTF